MFPATIQNNSLSKKHWNFWRRRPLFEVRNRVWKTQRKNSTLFFKEPHSRRMHLSRDVTINSPRAEGSASRMFQRWVGGTVDQHCCRLCQQKCSRATKTSSQLLLLPNWRSYHSCRRDGCHWGGSTVQPWASEGFFPGGGPLGDFS